MRIHLSVLFLILLTSPLYSKIYPLDSPSKDTKEQKGNKIKIYGNKIFTNEDILKVGRINDKGSFSRNDIVSTVKRIENFYVSKGYDLVEIGYILLMEEWFIFINEGRIGKIIIKGEDSLKTLLLKNAIRLKEDTFNSIDLKNMMEQIKREYGFKRVQYRLIPIPDNKATRIPFSEKLTEMFTFENTRSYIEPSYDLMIVVKKKDWGEGLGASLDYSSFGLISGISYSDSSFIATDDRFKVSINGGLNIRSNLDDGKNSVVLTLASLDMLYIPSILRFRYFKPDIEMTISDTSYMRADIPLNEYRIFSVDSSLLAGFELLKGMTFSYGLGTEFLYTHDFDYVLGKDVKLERVRLLRNYLHSRLNYLIKEIMFRSDLRENLRLKLRYYIPSEMESHWLISADYQKVYMFAFDYLKVCGGGKVLTGGIPFFDEFSIAYSSFKSSFSDRYYARDAIYLSLEYNLSLYRDILHAAIFTDFTLFYYKDYSSDAMYWLGAIDGGVGIKVLILDTFLSRIDYVEAFAFNGSRSNQILFSISKVF